MSNLRDRAEKAYETARLHLLESRGAHGHWEGRLSNSALSTATAVTALAIADHQLNGGIPEAHEQIHAGIDWLARHVNQDGGWGDTLLSHSNISTTTLVWAAFGTVKGADERYPEIVSGARRWLTEKAGGDTPEALCQAIIGRYGKDKTFSVPILTMLAVSGRIGPGKNAWKQVIQLPFELAALPQEWFATLRLPVVSYALPALIAIGLVKHSRSPSWNLLTRSLRNWATERTLGVLERIQPSNGGFLEATPLTSFVAMSLASCGRVGHPVVTRAVRFLLDSARPDGSWPIDTNLATWVTSLAIHGLGPEAAASLSPTPLPWLLQQQYRERHPYTNTPPGGWAWTDLPGGVPDADDTPGALIALLHLSGDKPTTDVVDGASAGIDWLLNLQNADGGMPTFCRGWTNLPFDQSSCDITAHTLRAMELWLRSGTLPERQEKAMFRCIRSGLAYLIKQQAGNGSWLPLWFGNQDLPGEGNPTYGTSKVLVGLAAVAGLPEMKGLGLNEAIRKGLLWLTETQHPCGGWSGGKAGNPSVEETALAIEAMASLSKVGDAASLDLVESLEAGVKWLCSEVERGTWTQASPIGFCFAKLWYFEDLYPVVFTTASLRAYLDLVR